MPCHEIEDALRFRIFLAQHGLDDLRRLRFGETALAQKALAVLVATGDRSRATLIPATNGTGEDLAKLASALDQRLAGLKFELGSGVSLCRESFLTRGNMNQIHATT